MKKQIFKNSFILIISMLLLTGLNLKAQDAKKTPPEKKHQKTVQLKMTTIDENGKKVTIDTSFTTTEPDEKVIMKKFRSKDADKGKQITMEIELDDEFPEGLSADSLEKQIMKQITVIAGPDGEFEWNSNDKDFEYQFFNENEMPKVMKFDCCPQQEAGCPMCRMRQQFGGQAQGFNFLSPTDIIKKFHIKKKRNGKKITIITENGDFWSMMPPPPPPVPPCPPECTKKIIMMNHDGEMKDVEKELKRQMKTMKVQDKAMKELEKAMQEIEKAKALEEKALKEKQEKETN